MSIERKDSITRYPSKQEWATNQYINQEEYKKIIEDNHTLYSRSGFRCRGFFYNNTFETTNTSFTQNNDLSKPGLWAWEGYGVFRRIDAYSGNPQADLRIMAAIQDAEIELRPTRINSDGTTSSLTNIQTSENTNNLDHSIGERTYSEAAVSDFGNADNQKAVIHFELYIRAIDADPSTNPAKPLTWMVGEDDLTSKDLTQ